MSAECPNPQCRSIAEKMIVEHIADDPDGLNHYWLVCKECGYNFNWWDCKEGALKKVFGANYKSYL